MTTNQFSNLLNEPWKFNDKEMIFYSFNPHTGKKDKKIGIFKGFCPTFMPDGTVRVERIHIGYIGSALGIHYTDVVLPKLTNSLYR